MNPPGVSQRSLSAISRKSYWRAEDARVMVAAWRASGLSVTAFARRHGVSRSRLVWWRDRVKAVAPRFLPVRVVTVATPAVAPLEVIAGSRRIVVPAGFDAAHLRAVLQALEDVAC